MPHPHPTMQLLTHAEHTLPSDTEVHVLVLANDADALTAPLDGITRVDLHFPTFTDGRAFTQAYLLRRRRGFTGDIRATGDVLIDQLLQMHRTGFSSAVLREGVDPSDAARQLARFAGFYQADAVHHRPHFSEAT